MVTNFENITGELTTKELEIVPIIILSFKQYSKLNPIKSHDIIKRYNASVGSKEIKLSQPRLRKICNHIRSFGLLPLIATNNGYYVSYEKEEIQDQITSLHERANSIVNCAIGLKAFLD